MQALKRLWKRAMPLFGKEKQYNFEKRGALPETMGTRKRLNSRSQQPPNTVIWRNEAGGLYLSGTLLEIMVRPGLIRLLLILIG